MAQRNKEHRFDLAPQVSIPRCQEPYHQNIKGTIKAGDMVPFFCDMGVNPADTYNIDMSSLFRMLTPITPVMDNCFADVYMFAVPWRICWEHTKEFWGENTESAWYTSTEYTIPKLKTGANASFDIGSIVDYMGLTRPGVNNVTISALPIRAYREIYSEWFRDQNLIAPPTKRLGDSDTTYDFTDPTKGGVPFKIAKYHDYFTSCLPGQQKGEAVTLPIGTTAPIWGNGNSLIMQYMPNSSITTQAEALQYTGNTASQSTTANSINFGYTGATRDQAIGYKSSVTHPGSLNTGNYAMGLVTKHASDLLTGSGDRVESGMYTDLTGALAAPISVVREAFAYQRILERMALAGSRYTELIKAFWGVNSPDQRLQRPEYLGGFSLPITMQQIPQTSSTDNISPQGNAAALSLTGDTRKLFTKSFTEHTIIIGILAIRQRHTYQQGTERIYSCFRKYDFYMPPLAHLSQQPVYNREIFTQGDSVTDANGKIVDEQVFGYQEAWAHYRYRPNRICGELRSDATLSLDVWHYGDDYANLPVLSEQFINETDEYIKRTLAVQETDTCQFLFDIEISGTKTTAMPKYSIPGLLDHY